MSQVTPPPTPPSPSASLYDLSDDEEGEYSTIRHTRTGKGVKLLNSKSKVLSHILLSVLFGTRLTDLTRSTSIPVHPPKTIFVVSLHSFSRSLPGNKFPNHRLPTRKAQVPLDPLNPLLHLYSSHGFLNPLWVMRTRPMFA